MATVDKAFRIKNGLVVEGATATVNTHDVITKEIFDAKGDLIVGTGSNTGTRVALGTNGYVLTANSATTNGVEWAAAPAVGSFETSIVFEGTTANDFETTLTVTDPTADRTITFPDATGTVVFKDTTDTLTNKSISLTTNTITGTKAEFNSAMSDADFATIAGSETLTNKTLTTPVISSITNGAATLTLPTSTGTVALTSDIPSLSGYVTESGTQTLTNKTLTSPTVSSLYLSDSSIIFEGSTDNTNETTLTVTNPTADRTITIPDVTGTVVTTGDTGSVTNGMLAGSIANEKLSNSAITINGTSVSLGGTRTLGSDDVSEGSTNKYFTDERAQDAIGNNIGNGLDYDDSTGAISVDPSEFTLNSIGAPSAAVALNSQKITGLGTPTDATDAATKAYVDSAAQGIDWKASVRAATTSNVTLASDLENGDTLDGVTLATGDRVLVKNQSTGSQNGIYVVKSSGAPDRSTDADLAAELTSNFAVFVEEGTVNADQGYVLTNDGAITVGTTALTFTQFTGLGQIIAGTGLDKTGNTLDIDSTVTTNDGTQTLTNKTINGSSNTITNVSLSTGVTGTLPVANGGTGITSLGTGIATFLGTPSSANLAAALTDESGSGTVAFTTSPTFVTPTLGAASGTSLSLSGALTATAVNFDNTLVGSNLATAGTETTNIDAWAVATYSSAKYIVQMKKGTDIEVLEVLVTVDGNNNVYLTEYADVISNTQLGTTNAVLSGSNVVLQVTAAANDTSVKVHKIYIEA